LTDTQQLFISINKTQTTPGKLIIIIWNSKWQHTTQMMHQPLTDLLYIYARKLLFII